MDFDTMDIRELKARINGRRSMLSGASGPAIDMLQLSSEYEDMVAAYSKRTEAVLSPRLTSLLWENADPTEPVSIEEVEQFLATIEEEGK